MADKQPAPQAHEEQTQPGSLWEAQEALLKLAEPEGETPETEEAAPVEEEESTEETQDESLEEETEEESEVEDESEESDEEEEVEELYTLRVDGQEVEVSLDELLKGYSRQSDYTKKTQEIAEQRKQAEQLQQQYGSEIAQIQAERQQYMESLQNVIQNSMPAIEQFGNVDWDRLKDADPIEYVKKKEEFREAQEKVQGMQMQYQQAYEQQAYEAQEQFKTHVRNEHMKFADIVPEWKEEKSRKKLATDIRDYAIKVGYSAEEVGQLADHRSLLVLMKAQKYDELQNADLKTKKLKNKAKVVRSGTGKSKEDSKKSRTAKMKRLRQTGHVDDAANLLEDLMNS
jgi:hypothetical protein